MQYVVSTAFIRDFLIGEADIASFSCYSKPPASAGGAFTLSIGQTENAIKSGLFFPFRHLCCKILHYKRQPIFFFKDLQ
jgi:hypothetical protein